MHLCTNKSLHVYDEALRRRSNCDVSAKDSHGRVQQLSIHVAISSSRVEWEGCLKIRRFDGQKGHWGRCSVVP